MIITKQLPFPARESVRLIWVDMEMSGLEPMADAVLEVAAIITDGNLRIIDEAPPWAVMQPAFILDNMDEWNAKTHGESGLIERCRHSTLTAAAVEEQVLAFLSRHAKAGSSPMCGNSICQDRRFMARHLPRLEAFFHYRNFDVSAFKIAMHLYAPEKLHARKKSESSHQALDDIRDSIDEMRYYAQYLWSDINFI